MRRRTGLAAKLALLCLAVLGSLFSSCSQGGVVEGEVRYKMVTGMQDRRYFIIVRSDPGNGPPGIVFEDTTEDIIRGCFPSTGDLVVDDATLGHIDALYDHICYMVTLHLLSGEQYTYYQACRTERDLFNQLKVGSRVKLDTEPSDVGPLITRIVG